MRQMLIRLRGALFADGSKLDYVALVGEFSIDVSGNFLELSLYSVFDDVLDVHRFIELGNLYFEIQSDPSFVLRCHQFSFLARVCPMSRVHGG